MFEFSDYEWHTACCAKKAPPEMFEFYWNCARSCIKVESHFTVCKTFMYTLSHLILNSALKVMGKSPGKPQLVLSHRNTFPKIWCLDENGWTWGGLGTLAVEFVLVYWNEEGGKMLLLFIKTLHMPPNCLRDVRRAVSSFNISWPHPDAILASRDFPWSVAESPASAPSQSPLSSSLGTLGRDPLITVD